MPGTLRCSQVPDYGHNLPPLHKAGARTIPCDLARPNRTGQGGTFAHTGAPRWVGPLDACGCPRGGHTGWCAPRNHAGTQAVRARPPSWRPARPARTSRRRADLFRGFLWGSLAVSSSVADNPGCLPATPEGRQALLGVADNTVRGWSPRGSDTNGQRPPQGAALMKKRNCEHNVCRSYRHEQFSGWPSCR